MGRGYVIEAAFDVEEERGGLEVKALKERDLMGEGRGGVKRGEAGEGAGLVRVEEAAGSGNEGETGGCNGIYYYRYYSLL